VEIGGSNPLGVAITRYFTITRRRRVSCFWSVRAQSESESAPLAAKAALALLAVMRQTSPVSKALDGSAAARGGSLYSLESYLFSQVTKNFQADGTLSAFDFFCIVVWKANRAKSKIAHRLLSATGAETLEDAVRTVTQSLSTAEGARARFDLLLDGLGLTLPMASAVLAVLYPTEFTVYDYRVCAALAAECGVEGHDRLGNVANPDRRWDGYQAYLGAVREAVPGRSLREADRALWGTSFASDLERDLASMFNPPDK
jgi:hypothetical protein